MTLVKYTPQVLHNHARRSTDGWNLTNVLLDLGGGVLSMAQVRGGMRGHAGAAGAA
jgi:cystinosin